MSTIVRGCILEILQKKLRLNRRLGCEEIPLDYSYLLVELVLEAYLAVCQGICAEGSRRELGRHLLALDIRWSTLGQDFIQVETGTVILLLFKARVGHFLDALSRLFIYRLIRGGLERAVVLSCSRVIAVANWINCSRRRLF